MIEFTKLELNDKEAACYAALLNLVEIRGVPPEELSHRLDASYMQSFINQHMDEDSIGRYRKKYEAALGSPVASEASIVANALNQSLQNQR